MDDAKDFIASVLKTIRDRLSNPFISAFAIAWIIWNFRIVLVLFGKGDGGWLAKLDYLDKRLMTTWWSWTLHGYLLPSVFALAWIYLLPPILRRIAVHHENQSGKSKAALLAAAEKSPISDEDRDKLLAKLAQERKSWDLERSELLKVISNNLSAPIVQTEAPKSLEHESQATQSAPTSEGEVTSVVEIPSISNPSDFFALSANQKAAFLGLRTKRNGESSSEEHGIRVTFSGLLIDWPWMPSKIRLPGLLARVCLNVSGKLFTDKELRLLFMQREVTMSIVGAPDFEFRSTIELLVQAGLADFQGRSFVVSDDGRIFLAWLIRVGFSFEDLRQAPGKKHN